MPGHRRRRRRAARHRRRHAAGRPRRVPVRPRSRPGARGRVALDARARPPRPAAGERQPQPARLGARGVAQVLELLDEAHADGCRSSPRSPGRSIGLLACLEGSVHPLLFHPAYQEVADLPLAERVARSAGAGPRASGSSTRCPTTAGSSSDPCWTSSTAIGRSPTATSTTSRSPRTRSQRRRPGAGVAPMELVLEQLLAARRPRHALTPFFNYAYGDLSFTTRPTVTPTPAWGWPTRAPTAARSATAARPPSCSRTGPATARGARGSPRARRPPADPPDRRALRPRTTGACWRRAAAPTST